jgi:hypothetical protein
LLFDVSPSAAPFAYDFFPARGPAMLLQVIDGGRWPGCVSVCESQQKGEDECAQQNTRCD